MSRCQHNTATRAIVRYYFPVFLFPYCVTFGESCPYKKTTTTKLQQRTHTQKQTKTNISDDHWDPQSELYHKQNPNSGPKNWRKPQTTAIAGYANPLKVCSESEIQAKILSGSVGPLAYSPPSAKHLRENPSHSFTWRVLSSAQTFHKRRILEGLMIQQFRPSLNKQVISYVSKLFPTGIT